MKTVMIFGTFDILHAGHFRLFGAAAKLGDRVIAVVGRDERVNKIKGKSPFHDERERLSNLRHIDYIDEVILGDKTDVYTKIKKIKPDIIALGYDQVEFVEELHRKIKEFGLSTKIVRLKPYKEFRYKTSAIKKYLESLV